MPPLTPMEMLSLFLPADMLDYFDLVNHVSQETCFILFLEEKPSIPQEYSHLHLDSKGFFPDFLFAVKLYTYASSAIVRETRKQDKLLVAIGTVSLFWILFFLQVTVLFRLVWLKCPCLLFSKLKAITHTFFSLYTRIFAGPSSVLSTSSFKHPAPGGDHNISLTTIYLLAFLTGLYFDNL